jgi:hypothetical protein
LEEVAMHVTLAIGLVVTFGLCLAMSLAFFAMDEEPQQQNLRAWRERVAAISVAAEEDLRAAA